MTTRYALTDHKGWWIGLSLLLLTLASFVMWLQRATAMTHQPATPTLPGQQSAASKEPIIPLPQSVQLDPLKVALGGRLFRETRLSRTNSVSCATCHALDQGGVDRLRHSVGIHNQVGGVNAPTVFNSGFNFRQFWDGRAATLEEQAAGPITNAAEMGSSWDHVLAVLNGDGSYVAEFKSIYRDGVQVRNIRDAIATFERSLITPNSRFDRYLNGDAKAITADERNGYRLFKSYGCIACHQGINVGGNMFQKFGVMKDYFKGRENVNPADLGRFNITQRPEDRHVFKVPSLRNVASTGPYFHDGSAVTLEQAIAIMGQYQLGVTIPDADIALIAKFLHALTGEYQGKPL